MSVSRTEHRKTLSIESRFRKPSIKSALTSHPTPFIQLCRLACWAVMFWRTNWLRFCSPTSSTTCLILLKKSDRNSKILKLSWLILDHQCPQLRVTKCIFCGTWLPNLFRHIKTKFKVNMMHAELTPLKAAPSEPNSQEVPVSRWAFTDFTET